MASPAKFRIDVAMHDLLCRTSGEKLSAWVDNADFVSQYQKIGQFWLPLKDQTSVHVKFYGRRILTVEHQSYSLNEVRSAQAQQTGQSAE